MEESLIEYFKEQMGCSVEYPNQYAPLTMAYIGDSVFDLLVKTYFVSQADMKVQKYHRLTSGVVKAQAQAQMLHAIEPELTEAELDMYRRGRNAKSYTKAKNATTMDYRTATGFEALIGYLYLDRQYRRLADLVKMGFERTVVPLPEHGIDAGSGA